MERESNPAEWVGLGFGLGLIFPYVYQLRVNYSTPVNKTCWLLYAIGWFGVSLYFVLVPRAPEGTQLQDFPESPRSIGYAAFVASLLCQWIWAKRHVESQSGSGFEEKKTIAEYFTTSALASLITAVAILALHHTIFRSRLFFRDLLTLVAYISIAAYFVGEIIAALDLNGAQLKLKELNPAGGLHYTFVVLRTIALVFLSTLCDQAFTTPDDHAKRILELLMISDTVYFAIGFVDTEAVVTVIKDNLVKL